MAKKRESVVKTRNREIRKVKVSDLEDAPFNFRRHSDRQSDALNGAIDEIGVFGYPDVFETADGKLMLCDGHLRKALYTKKYGKDAIIEVNVTDFNEAEAKKATLTKDPIAAMADTDAVALADLMAQVDIGNESVLGMLRDLTLASTDLVEETIEFEEDEVPEPPADPITKTGDLWILGDNHRVLCGDSTKPEDVARLMGDEKADLWITDPPYNVDYTGGTGLKIANDNMGDAQFLRFLVDAFRPAIDALKPGAACYIWHADSEGLNFRRAVHECGQEVKQCLIWVKNSLVMGRQDYQWQHEPCLYFWKKGGSHRWHYGRSETTVIDDAKPAEINKMKREELVQYALDLRERLQTRETSVLREQKPSRNLEHPTMKPIKLIARLMRNSSERGNLVLDSFLGSATTIVAAENMGRRCFGLEMSSAYVDVGIHRWQALTGKDAILETTGETFSQVNARLCVSSH